MIQYLGEDIRGEGIVIVIQTSRSYEHISNICRDTWLQAATGMGYDVAVVDYIYSGSSFIDILLLEEFQRYTYIMPMFEDLYFLEFSIPTVSNILNRTKTLEIDYLRLDGRPPEKDISFVLEGYSYGRISENYRYMYSTVLSCFSRGLLFELRFNGCSSAWDIEDCTKRLSKNLYAVSKRTSKYRNLIVKGKIDVLELIAVKELRIGLLYSIKRKLNRFLRNLVQ